MSLDTSLSERADALLRDIDDALHEDALASHAVREDWPYAHVADLGNCDRQTAYRRQGAPALPHSDETLRKFETGLEHEERMMRAIARRVPDLMRGIRLAMWPDFGGIGSKLVDEAYVPQAWEMLGHPDGVSVAREAVIEAKSTTFWNFKLPTLQSVFDENRHYIYQTAAYCLALRKPLGILSIVCRGTQRGVRILIDPRVYEATILTRMVDVLATTTSDVPLPEAKPPEWTFKFDKRKDERVSWMCKNCPYAQCDENPRHTNGRVFTTAE